MNTARIVVLTIAVGAGGIAAGPVSGSDNRLARSVANGATRRAIADLYAVENRSGPGPRRGASVNPVRYAAAGPAAQK